MEYFTSRCIDYTKDLKHLMDLWIAYRTATDVRRNPTTWRLRLLLTSRVWNAEQDVRLWETTEGQIAGMAMLWRRKSTSSYLVLDCLIHPKFVWEELPARILQWGDQRTREIIQEQRGTLTVYATGLSQYEFSSRLIISFGYTNLTLDPEEHNVYYAMLLDREIKHPALPVGYRIDHLRVDDSEAFQAVFGFATVNPSHLREQIESDEYCHILVRDERNNIAAYCECSFCRAEWEATGQYIGWIDYIETMPEKQGKGLGRSILAEGLGQLKAWGATVAMLVTIKSNRPAMEMYQKAGFEVVEIEEFPTYEKKISSQAESS